MAFLEITNLSKVFGECGALHDVDLAIERGEFVSLLGPSGCGKTTTLRIVAGFETPTTGTVRIDGQDVTHRPANRRNVGMVFQSYALFPHMTVSDNIGFGLKVARKSRADIRWRVAELLQIVHMSELAGRYPHELSGGERQRVALARALAIRPHVLLLDEPLSALDAKIRVSLREEIRAIQRHLGITTIYVTHDQEEALAISDRVAVMCDGRIEQCGTPAAIYNEPQTAFVASFVGMLNLLPARVVDAASGRLAVDGHVIRAARPIVDSWPGKAVLVALRPETIALHGGACDDNHVPAIVEEVLVLGAVVRVRARIREHALHCDMFNDPRVALPRRGQQVELSFPPAVCVTLDEQPPDAPSRRGAQSASGDLSTSENA
jgi:putative spermidine/putrescine transport system ATP-binding protein